MGPGALVAPGLEASAAYAYGDQGILRFAVAATSSPPVALPATGGVEDLAGASLALALALTLSGLALRRRGMGLRP